jgi:hypothetical protein
MAPSWTAGVLAAIVVAVASTVNAACSSNLVVDNFANWASNNNTLGGYTSGKHEAFDKAVWCWTPS